jgi:hypothetical protein
MVHQWHEEEGTKEASEMRLCLPEGLATLGCRRVECRHGAEMFSQSPVDDTCSECNTRTGYSVETRLTFATRKLEKGSMERSLRSCRVKGFRAQVLWVLRH